MAKENPNRNTTQTISIIVLTNIKHIKQFTTHSSTFSITKAKPVRTTHSNSRQHEEQSNLKKTLDYKITFYNSTIFSHLTNDSNSSRKHTRSPSFFSKISSLTHHHTSQTQSQIRGQSRGLECVRGVGAPRTHSSPRGDEARAERRSAAKRRLGEAARGTSAATLSHLHRESPYTRNIFEKSHGGHSLNPLADRA